MFALQLLRYIAAVAVILLLAWWCSRKLGGRYGRCRTEGRIRILEQAACGPEQRIILLEWEGKQYLIGVSSHGMTLLAEKEMDQTGRDEDG